MVKKKIRKFFNSVSIQEKMMILVEEEKERELQEQKRIKEEYKKLKKQKKFSNILPQNDQFTLFYHI